MFLEFFVWGAWYTTVAVYMAAEGLGDLTHWPYTVNPLAAIIAPFFLGLVADRYFAAQKVFGVLHLLGGVFMLAGAVAHRRADAVHPGAAGLQPVLHAHARAVEHDRVRAARRPGEGVPRDPSVRDAGLDRGRARHLVRAEPRARRRVGRGDGVAALPDRHRVAHPGRVLVHAAQHAARRQGPAGVARVDRGRRRLPAAGQQAVLHLPGGQLPDLHPAGGLLQLHPALPGRDRLREHRRDAVAGSGLGGPVHAPDAAPVRALGCQVDAGRGHVRLGRPLRAVRARRAGLGHLDDRGRDRAPRHLLRLLLRDGPDLRREEERRRPSAARPKGSWCW